MKVSAFDMPLVSENRERPLITLMRRLNIAIVPSNFPLHTQTQFPLIAFPHQLLKGNKRPRRLSGGDSETERKMEESNFGNCVCAPSAALTLLVCKRRLLFETLHYLRCSGLIPITLLIRNLMLSDLGYLTPFAFFHN